MLCSNTPVQLLPVIALSSFLEHSSLISALCLSSAIRAWGRSRSFGNAERAYALLSQMKRLRAEGKIEARPNIFCYNAALNACAFSHFDENKKTANLNLAITVFKEMQASSDCAPDEMSYVNLIAALRNLMPPSPERVAAVSNVFHLCAKNRQLDKTVIQRVQTALTIEQRKELVGSDKVNEKGWIMANRLPKEWFSEAEPTDEADRRKRRNNGR